MNVRGRVRACTDWPAMQWQPPAESAAAPGRSRRTALFLQVCNVTQLGWKIAAGMQEINDDHFVFSFQKHHKMLFRA